MQSLKDSKSSYQLVHTDDAVQIRCQGRKPRSAIYFGVGYDDLGLAVFEKLPKRILDQFELLKVYGALVSPTPEELSGCAFAIQETCQSARFLTETSRKRRIRKKKEPSEARDVINYGHIRALFFKHRFSIKFIAEHFKMSRVTVRRIIRQYQVVGANIELLNATIINRSKGKRKYHDETSIVNYMKELAEPREFKGIVNVNGMIKLLKEKFGNDYDFKRTKVANMMKQAGLKFKKVKVDIAKNANSVGLCDEQKIHLAKLVRAIATNELLIFVDETYVTRQLIPKRLWVRVDREARRRVSPKDDRVTVVAACSFYCLEAFQILYEAIDATHYCMFVLAVYERLKQKYPGKQPIFIHDNARPHVGKICSKVLLDFPFVRQSAYSPQMNLIEYIFGFFKKAYRNIADDEKQSVRQEVLIRRSFEMVKQSMFTVSRLEHFKYCLKTLKEENMLI